MNDILTEIILEIINKAREPLETKEIENLVEQRCINATRTMIVYRLNKLRGDGLILGKLIGKGRGAWIWWKKRRRITSVKRSIN